jgi:hypothetical protein
MIICNDNLYWCVEVIVCSDVWHLFTVVTSLVGVLLVDWTRLLFLHFFTLASCEVLTSLRIVVRYSSFLLISRCVANVTMCSFQWWSIDVISGSVGFSVRRSLVSWFFFLFFVWCFLFLYTVFVSICLSTALLVNRLYFNVKRLFLYSLT